MVKTFLINQFIIILKHMKVLKKIPAGYRDDCTTGCLLDCPFFKGNYKMIAIDLSKHQALDANPRAI